MERSDHEAGLLSVKSRHSVADTLEKFSNALHFGGLTEFYRMDHSANAESAGMKLRPTVLILFGNPKGGTPLMQERQTTGIDLPVKVLIWEDENGEVWLTYNDPAWLAKRHRLTAQSHDSLQTTSAGLQMLAARATA
jgi:uncharacterized protein (DUF302 family)